MEGTCFENRRALDLVACDGAAASARLLCTGGGARSDVWNQIRADICERPVSALAAREGGIVGAALLAGVGAGWYDNARAAAEALDAPHRHWQPRAEVSARYRQGYATFRSVHDSLNPGWTRWHG